jgi:hypothetical protein
MNTSQQSTLTRQDPDSNPNARFLCNAGAGSRLAYRDIRVRIREKDIRERDISERDTGGRNMEEMDIQEMDIGETVATCRFAG